jgi:DNA-binding transcriptional ArsR family regulator
MKNQAENIRKYILDSLNKYPSEIVTKASEKFGVTRMTIHRHLETLIKNKLVIKSGKTKGAKYYLADNLSVMSTYNIDKSISEDYIFDKDFSNLKNELNSNIFDIAEYGITEIVNNAIDHSKGDKLTVKKYFEDSNICFEIIDDGIGLFQKIYNYFSLDDIRESVLQLSKGKMTTMPKDHTGEGIFFSSRAFDKFEIWANNIYYIRDNIENDWAFSETSTKPGTIVKMTINIKSIKNIVDIFKSYQSEEDLSFNRTEILVSLSKLKEETLISRSQAKRILLGLEKFDKVTLDFEGVRLVGQGFVDEIFRVFSTKNPKIHLDYINANKDVEFMIKRGVKN